MACGTVNSFPGKLRFPQTPTNGIPMQWIGHFDGILGIILKLLIAPIPVLGIERMIYIARTGSGGNLVITATKQSTDTKEYKSGRILTRDKAKWTFGVIAGLGKHPERGPHTVAGRRFHSCFKIAESPFCLVACSGLDG